MGSNSSKIMKYEDESAEEAIFMALGYASVAWSESLVFKSEDVQQVGEELIEHLRKLRLLPDPEVAVITIWRRCPICGNSAEAIDNLDGMMTYFKEHQTKRLGREETRRCNGSSRAFKR